MILCARSTLRSREQRTKCMQITWRQHVKGLLIFSIVKITRFYDYQTWQTLSLLTEKFTRCAKVCGLVLLFFSDADWLVRETPITWL